MSEFDAFKLLLILTSATLAIAQYYDNRHSSIVKDALAKIKGLQISFSGVADSIQKIKAKWERALNEKTINNQIIIVILWAFFGVYSFLLATILIMPYFIKISAIKPFLSLKFVIMLPSIGMAIISIWLTIKLFRMKKQRDRILGDLIEIEAFHEISKAITDSINNSDIQSEE